MGNFLLTAALFFLLFCTILLIPYVVYSLVAIFTGAPFATTGKRHIHDALTLTTLKPEDVFVDLGSGDGRVVFEAAKTGAQCVGVEINPALYWASLLKAWGKKNIFFKRKNFWNVDLSDVDVLFIYFIPEKMERLRKKIEREMKSGSRVLSHGFQFPSWQYNKKNGKIYLYNV